jgi:hypothetical protein
MNKFQNTVRQLTKKREEEEFDAFEKEYGTFDDHVDTIETECPVKPWIQVEFHVKDEEAYAKWEKGLDNLRCHHEIKREVKAELKKGPRL